ncbi:hypothetical protein AAC387_Pa09g0527 [Persea americana]
MVQHHRNHQLRKSQEKEETSPHVLSHSFFSSAYMKTIPTLSRFLFLLFFCFLFSFFFYCRVFSAHFGCSCSVPSLYLFGMDEAMEYLPFMGTEAGESIRESPCSSVSNGSICCDRTGFRSDLCFMKGDVRTSSAKSSIFLYSSDQSNNEQEKIERIRPYTRKWETNTMDTIDELRLIARRSTATGGDILNHTCQVQHSVPAIFFSTGGYTGNVYHEFNDGILPLYITSRQFNRRVVFVILEYHSWWISKYSDILAQLSDYPPIDFTRDQTVHCFPQAIVGLQIHDELTVSSSLMPNNRTIQDFRNLLDDAYTPRIRGIIKEEESQAQAPSIDNDTKKLKLVILSRNGSRAIMNEEEVVKLAQEIGFHVTVLRPTPSTELAKIYRALNSSDAMLGIHGAAMTHLLFMRPGSVFIQVVPLGTNWAAQTYYGEPAMKLGVKYISYNILPKESSLYEQYEKDDPVLTDPESVTNKGWQETKRVYLDQQNVKIDLRRFRKRLVRAYEYSMAKRRGSKYHQQWQ